MIGLHKHQLTKRVVGVFLLLSVFLAALSPLQVAAQNDDGGSNNGADQSTTCAVEKIGWIVCPIMEGASDLADKTFNMLAGAFLEIDAELLNNNEKGTLVAWEQARNLANVMFIIAFLAIIYSQVTGAGLNNYGVKRMLPRLIIAAIAVNVSYYICQAMVDLSNVLGYEIKRALDDIANDIGPSVLGQSSTQGGTSNTETGSGLLKVITIAALAVAGVVWFFLAIGTGIITLVFITAITIVIILLMRKAFIVLLVVVSPIAFVLYLLPNTEKFFEKWLSMFWKLLMVFPIVALLFGAGNLASTIILVAGSSTNSGTETQQNTEQCVANANKRTSEQREESGYDVIPCQGKVQVGDQQSTWSLGLIAMGVAIAPLLAVWAVLKGALAAGGAIAGKIGGAIAKGTSGSVKGVGGAYMKHAAPVLASKAAQSGNKFIRGAGMAATGNVGWRGGRRMASMAAKYDKEETAVQLDKWSRDGTLQDTGELARIAKKSGLGSIEGQAALQYLAQSEAVEDLAGLRQGLTGKDRDAYDRAIASKYGSLKAKDPRAVMDMSPAEWGKLSPAKIAALKDKAIQEGAAASPEFRSNLSAALADPRLQSSFSPQIKQAYGASSSGSSGGTGGTSQQTARRLSFNTQNAAGGIVRRSGRDVLGQMYAAGGTQKVTTEDLVSAVRHAEEHLGRGGADEGHEELGTQAVEELARRGLDHEGRQTGRAGGPTGPPSGAGTP